MKSRGKLRISTFSKNANSSFKLCQTPFEWRFMWVIFWHEIVKYVYVHVLWFHGGRVRFEKNGKLSFHKGSCHFFHQARCKFGNTFKLCHTPFDWRFYFFCARNFERQKNRKNKLQNFLWTLIFRPFFEKHQKSVFFVLQVIEQNDNFWTLKHGVLFFSVFFQKFYKLQYLPEQAITFGTIELNWTRHFSLFLTNNDTEGVKQCFFVVNKSSPCFCD